MQNPATIMTGFMPGAGFTFSATSGPMPTANAVHVAMQILDIANTAGNWRPSPEQRHRSPAFCSLRNTTIGSARSRASSTPARLPSSTPRGLAARLLSNGKRNEQHSPPDQCLATGKVPSQTGLFHLSVVPDGANRIFRFSHGYFRKVP